MTWEAPPAGAPRFRPGRNVAMKLPERLYEATLGFYRDTLGLELMAERPDGAVLAWNGLRLHLDRVSGQSQTDIWLEVVADDTAAARRHLAARGVSACPEVEPLPEGFDGFWIAAPSGTIHLVAGATD